MDKRHRDAAKIADYLSTECGQDMSFFANIFAGTQDPWEKLALNDVNKQMVQFKNPHGHFAEKARKQEEEKKNATVKS
jgi:hypothetical protein